MGEYDLHIGDRVQVVSTCSERYRGRKGTVTAVSELWGCVSVLFDSSERSQVASPRYLQRIYEDDVDLEELDNFIENQ